MLWVRALHIFFMVTWFAGLLYLPRLFVYHAMTEDVAGQVRFNVMQRKLFAIMTIGGVGTLVFGLWLLALIGWQSYAGTFWLHLKMTLVAVLIAYHVYCAKLLIDFKRGRNAHSHVYFRLINEVPAILLIAIVILAVVKPF